MADDTNVSGNKSAEVSNQNDNNKQEAQFNDSMKNQGSANEGQTSGLSAEANGKGAGSADYKNGADYKSLTAENKNVVDKYMDTLNSAGPFNAEQQQGTNARGEWFAGVVNNAQKAGVNITDGTTPQEYKAIMDKVQSTPGEAERLSGLQDDYTNKLQNSLNGTDKEDLVKNVADGHVEFGSRMVNGQLTTINEAGNDNKTVADAATDLDFMTKTGKFANARLSA
jgi:hypothetical protein